jgi:hypothetical protein
MERRSIRSTSLNSATCSDIELRVTKTGRLVFRPQLVDNPKSPAASVHGTFLFQKKGPKDEWEDSKSIPLNSLKMGEGVKLDLHASEVLALFEELRALYHLYDYEGVPIGETHLVKVNSLVAQLADLPVQQLRTFLNASESLGDKLLTRILAWATEETSFVDLAGRLVALGSGALQNLSLAASLGNLNEALEIWEKKSDCADEEFWQVTFAQNSYVLEQVFSWPATIVKGKAYVGGKSLENTGGNLVDFLMKNDITSNAALVEIKTPKTKLLGKQYRAGVYAPSEDLSGSLVQVLNYKHSLQSEIYSLNRSSPTPLRSFSPRCVVIIGNADCLGDDAQSLSFELFRSQSSEVVILTYDEVFAKIRRLVDLLKGSDSALGERKA